VIDQEWLDRSLRASFPSGERLQGVAGVGGSVVAVKYLDRAGKPWVVRLPRQMFYLASYIHEVPPGFAPTPQYSVARLNKKLLGLVGDIQLYEYVESYHDLFTALISGFADEGVTALGAVVGETDDATRALRFLLQTPVMAYRLDELESGDHEPETRRWAARARNSLRRLGPEDRELRPSTLLDNPLLVWCGVVMAGYFTTGQLPAAARAAATATRKVDDDRIGAFVNQADVILTWLAELDPDSSQVDRAAAMCDATGIFPWTVMRPGRGLPADEERTEFLSADAEGDDAPPGE
jgi:hypothetical protein